MGYIFLQEQISLPLHGKFTVWDTRTWNSNRQSSCWTHERGYVVNSHRFGYKNENQSLHSCVLYDQIVKRSVTPALYSIPYLVFDTESYIHGISIYPFGIYSVPSS